MFCNNLPNSKYPVLFIIAMALGTLIGAYFDLDSRFNKLTTKAGGESFAKGLSTAILLFCIGYAFDIPQNVKEFIQNNTFETDYFYIICTYGNKSGGIEERVQRFMQEINKPVNYINSLLMVDNFLPGYDLAEQLKMDKKIDENFAKIKENIENRVDFVKAETETDRKDYEIMLSYNFDFKYINKYIVTDDCIGCGICAKVCPKSCIEIIEKRAKQDNTNCLTCLACVNACPKKALKIPIPNERFPYPEPNPNVRFKNPNVTLQEIIKANCQE